MTHNSSSQLHFPTQFTIHSPTFKIDLLNCGDDWKILNKRCAMHGTGNHIAWHLVQPYSIWHKLNESAFISGFVSGKYIRLSRIFLQEVFLKSLTRSQLSGMLQTQRKGKDTKACGTFLNENWRKNVKRMLYIYTMFKEINCTIW